MASQSSALCKESEARKEHNLSSTTISQSAHKSSTCRFIITLSQTQLTGISLGSPEQQAQWNQSALGRTAFAEQIFKRIAYTSDGRPVGGINFRDNLRENDASKTPLEFIYEAADCRMFYTAPMITDVTMVWKGVVDRMFRNDDRRVQCVQGSTGAPSSISGGGQEKNGSVPPPPPPQNAGLEQSNLATRTGGRFVWPFLYATLFAALYM